MISFHTIPEPKCLADLAAANPLPKFGDPGTHDCLKRVIRPALLANQNYQCAYCEAPIKDDGDCCHLAHIISQKDNPSRRFDVTNLMAACQCKDTCGHGHGEASLSVELNPYLAPKLHRRFHCDGLGKLTACGLSPSSETFAFGPVNLNSPGLKTQRATVIRNLMDLTIALGANAKRKLRTLSTRERGFISLHYQVLGDHGFPEP